MGTALDLRERERRGAQAAELAGRLAAQDIVAVALTWVDNSGVTRVKTVPVERLAHAAAWGVGASPVFDAFLADDFIVAGRCAGGPVGDLRLLPDLGRVTPLAAQPGWAWSPATRYAQDGRPHPQDARSVLRRAVGLLAELGLTAQAAIETEWALSTHGTEGGEFVSATDGPAYGFARVVEQSDYLAALLRALRAQGIEVHQVHPEYGRGQFELSVAAQDPLAAADTSVLARATIRAVSAAHGLRASFAPKVLADGVGNGGHVHLSLWREGENLHAGGRGDENGHCGLSAEAEQFAAGILERLPALLAVGAPSVSSYLRLVPGQWSGPFQVAGAENRECALRLISGSLGEERHAANMEIKVFDLAANPYLAIAALVFAGLSGIRDARRLPPLVDVDPATLSDQERAERGIRRLPATLRDAVDALADDEVLAEGFGRELTATLVDLRRADIERCSGMSGAQITAAVRWVY